MTDKDIICTSCKTKVSNMVGTVIFKCPKCSKVDIVRCERCRRVGIKYRCSCGFEGPN